MTNANVGLVILPLSKANEEASPVTNHSMFGHIACAGLYAARFRTLRYSSKAWPWIAIPHASTASELVTTPAATSESDTISANRDARLNPVVKCSRLVLVARTDSAIADLVMPVTKFMITRTSANSPNFCGLVLCASAMVIATFPAIVMADDATAKYPRLLRAARRNSEIELAAASFMSAVPSVDGCLTLRHPALAARTPPRMR